MEEEEEGAAGGKVPLQVPSPISPSSSEEEASSEEEVEEEVAGAMRGPVNDAVFEVLLA